MIDWGELVLRLAHHIRLTGVSLALGVALCAPLAVLCLRVPRVRGPVLGVVSVVQTIPSLALLALMVVLLGKIGFVPALVALTAYSLLPILRNAVTGLESVDRDAVEAARGIGMTWSQTLWHVRLPLAMPVIVAGLRTATVWVVGMAVLATPVGEVSLGNYIFSGLQLSNNRMVLTGIVAAVVLVFVLDGLIRLAEVFASQRRWWLAGGAGGALVAVLVGGTAPLWSFESRSDRRVVIGAKTFTEQYILAELISDVLEASGYEPEIKAGLGSTVAFEAVRSGEIDLYVDYTGTIWANQMKRDDVLSRDATLEEVARWLRSDHGITSSGSLGFENAYVFVTRADVAARIGEPNIGSLRGIDGELTLGGDYEFFDRPEWMRFQDTYALDFARLVSMDSTLMYQACQSGDVDVITAFGTDGRIAAFDLVSLRDDLGAFPPYDAFVLVSPDNTQLGPALSVLHNAIDLRLMREANRMVDQDGRTPKEAAEWLVSQIGLPSPP